ncbi:MAG: GNAT family N-acetyltransferase [SAR324 cluster bacterium]|uniref:GNAT family N-acetyltransferase n=1 Tax=SAR324 cluster bacterium TaxID=2024889 RepID=A0A7X9IJA2_9DELT|nr:GNAT family N-acetyltransferase [SAR324 cluster bacterium]
MENVEIRLIEGLEGIEFCAKLMADIAPWKVLGMGIEECRKHFEDESREKYVVILDKVFAGFLIIHMEGTFSGYIQSIAIAPEFQRKEGLGSSLIEFAEERIFKDRQNVFLCVSSFNSAAQHFYSKHGYETIGEIKDFIVSGHSEVFLRKSKGPLRENRVCL